MKLHMLTRCYKELHEATRSYMRLYIGLLEATLGNMRLHKVA